MRTQTYQPVRKHRVSQSVARKNGGCRVERRQPDTKIVGRYVIKNGSLGETKVSSCSRDSRLRSGVQFAESFSKVYRENSLDAKSPRVHRQYIRSFSADGKIKSCAVYFTLPNICALSVCELYLFAPSRFDRCPFCSRFIDSKKKKKRKVRSKKNCIDLRVLRSSWTT